MAKQQKAKGQKKRDSPILYKYVSYSTFEKIVQSKRILFNSPLKFNDPFDCNFPGISEQKLTAKLRRDVAPKLRQKILKEAGVLGKGSVPDINKELLKFYASIAKEAKTLLEGLRTEWDTLIDKFRILCLAKEQDNLLLWSHYADCHKGVVLGIDMTVLHIQKEWGRNIIYEPQKSLVETIFSLLVKNIVEHFSNDMDADAVAGQQASLLLKTLLDFLFIKNKIWAYEKEWRYILPKDSLFLQDDYLLLPEDAVKEIIFGIKCRISDDMQNKIMKEFPHAILKKASKQNGKFILKNYEQTA